MDGKKKSEQTMQVSKKKYRNGFALCLQYVYGNWHGLKENQSHNRTCMFLKTVYMSYVYAFKKATLSQNSIATNTCDKQQRNKIKKPDIETCEKGLCVGGQQQKILYVSLRQPPNTVRRDKSQENGLQDICLCLVYTSYLKILCRSHVSDSCRSVHQ